MFHTKSTSAHPSPARRSNSRIVAVLGPTNTGKTHTAVERMLGHATGMIGLPLRLLAREVYDRIVAIKGPTRVALITGEEKIVPDNPAYYVCTVESMPLEKDVGFLAVDEIQLCSDYQRGHIFTDRLLRARGQHETMLMGSDTIRPLIKALIPEAEIMSRPRFSELSYVKPRKLSRLPGRTAIVAFTASDVYAVAELLRRQKGGAAIVMGALSPRTRNAQVELYQSGDVDYLVATDAIGMGLNMDIDHVVFAGTRKFDGRLMRNLYASELAQIAGRAGRHMNNGSFSVLTGGANSNGNGSEPGLDPMIVAQIEDHKFEPLKGLMWRNPKPDFSSPKELLRSLNQRPDHAALGLAPEAVDQAVLRILADDPEVMGKISSRESVHRLWDACQVPDFRKISSEDHTGLIKRIFLHRASGEGQLPHDWIARQVSHLDNVQGDIDTLAQRIAGIRIWTYVAHRRGWLAERSHWEHVTRSIEDKLSDALHQRLMQRFVDRRTAVLMRELKQKGDVFVNIEKDDSISVEGHEIGHLKGFSFYADGDSDSTEKKLLNNAAERMLKKEVEARAGALVAGEDSDLSLDSIGDGAGGSLKIAWQGADIAYLIKGEAPLRPRVKLPANTMLAGEAAERVKTRLEAFVRAHIVEVLEPLVRLDAELSGEPAPEGAAPLTGLARGVAFRLVESLGVLRRADIDAEMRQIDQDARKGLRRFGIRIGSGSLFMAKLLKPKPTALRINLWGLFEGRDKLPAPPTPGMVWTEMAEGVPGEFYTLAGFRPAGKKAIRVDMLERLADDVRPLGRAKSSEGGVFETTPEIMGLVGLSGEDFIAAMRAIGYRRAPAPAAKAAPATATKAAPETPEGEKPELKAEKNTEVKVEDKSQEKPEEKNEPLYFRWQPQDTRPRAAKSATTGSKKKPQEMRNARKVKAPGNKNEAKPHRRPSKARPSPKPRPNSNPKPKPERPLDPNSPFAALQGLKDSMTRSGTSSGANSGGKPGNKAKSGK